MDNKIDPCDTMRTNLIAAAVGLQQYTKTASNIIPIPGGDRVIAIGTPAEVRALLAADIDAPAAPTDLSKRLRDAATAEVSYADARLLIGAAEEIERYYGGMMAWKRTAEAKDAAFVRAQSADGSEGGHHD